MTLIGRAVVHATMKEEVLRFLSQWYVIDLLNQNLVFRNLPVLLPVCVSQTVCVMSSVACQLQGIPDKHDYIPTMGFIKTLEVGRTHNTRTISKYGRDSSSEWLKC